MSSEKDGELWEVRPGGVEVPLCILCRKTFAAPEDAYRNTKGGRYHLGCLIPFNEQAQVTQARLEGMPLDVLRDPKVELFASGRGSVCALRQAIRRVEERLSKLPPPEAFVADEKGQVVHCCLCGNGFRSWPEVYRSEEDGAHHITCLLPAAGDPHVLARLKKFSLGVLCSPSVEAAARFQGRTQELNEAIAWVRSTRGLPRITPPATKQEETELLPVEDGEHEPQPSATVEEMEALLKSLTPWDLSMVGESEHRSAIEPEEAYMRRGALLAVLKSGGRVAANALRSHWALILRWAHNPESSPYGKAAKEALEALNLTVLAERYCKALSNVKIPSKEAMDKAFKSPGVYVDPVLPAPNRVQSIVPKLDNGPPVYSGLPSASTHALVGEDGQTLQVAEAQVEAGIYVLTLQDITAEKDIGGAILGTARNVQEYTARYEALRQTMRAFGLVSSAGWLRSVINYVHGEWLHPSNLAARDELGQQDLFHLALTYQTHYIREKDRNRMSTQDKTAPAPSASLTPEGPSVLKTLEADARDAAWRTAGSQFVKLTREPLVGLLSRHLGPGDESLRARIAAFLETEIGTALLASMLSLGLAAVPAGSRTGEVPQRLSRELRVRAMADAGDVVADLLMGPLRQVISLYLQGDVQLTAPSGPYPLPAGESAPADFKVPSQEHVVVKP